MAKYNIYHMIENLKQDNNSTLINNKDYLIISLLKYICTIHDVPIYTFNYICDYLVKNNVIENIDLNSIDTVHLKIMCTNLIKNIADHGNNKELYNIDYSDCRYNKNFVQECVLGQGGYGCVYDARYILDNNRYAVKKIYIKELSKEKSKYYLNEVRLLSQLNHENIVRYYTSWIEFEITDTPNKKVPELTDPNILNSQGIIISRDIVKPVLYIQMELCKKSLDSYIKNRNFNNEEIIKNDEYIFIEQIIKGLKYIHKNGIIHGDLTPQNIFIDSNSVIKIGDFGLAKKTEILYENKEFGSYGNLLYMAKEQIEQNICNIKSDIYSFGIIYMELLSKFKSQAKRAKSIQEFKKNAIINNSLISDYDLELLKNMLSDDYECRFDITQVETLFYDKIMI
jgi:serine/threonine protein kinase